MDSRRNSIKCSLEESFTKDETENAAYIAQARDQYAEVSKDIEIDETPQVSIASGGAWVSAWVWVEKE